MPIQITEAVPDLEEYNFLRSSVDWSLMDEETCMKNLSPSVYSIIARDGCETVGMGRIAGHGGVFFLVVDIIVIPDYQNKGIGKLIVKNLTDWIKANCARDSRILLVAAEGREGFYEKFGFQKVPNSSYRSEMQWIWKEN